MDMTTAAGLWLAVILSGLYHGLNPGMGWPLAVSSALFERRRSALWPALGALSLGHFAAMLGILLPFSMMTLLIDFQREIRIGAALIVIAMGLYLVITRRHPRFLARIPPHKLTLCRLGALSMMHEEHDFRIIWFARIRSIRNPIFRRKAAAR